MPKLITPDERPTAGHTGKPRKALKQMADDSTGNAGSTGCRSCGGVLKRKTLNGVRCAHCGGPR